MATKTCLPQASRTFFAFQKLFSLLSRQWGLQFNWHEKCSLYLIKKQRISATTNQIMFFTNTLSFYCAYKYAIWKNTYNMPCPSQPICFDNPNNILTTNYEKKTRWRSWLSHCATSRKVARSTPYGVTAIFQWLNPSGRTMALGSTHTKRNEYQGSSPGCKGGRCVGLTTLLHPRADSLEILGASTSLTPKGLSRPLPLPYQVPASSWFHRHQSAITFASEAQQHSQKPSHTPSRTPRTAF